MDRIINMFIDYFQNPVCHIKPATRSLNAILRANVVFQGSLARGLEEWESVLI